MRTKIHKINRKRFAEMFADDTQDELGDRCYELFLAIEKVTEEIGGLRHG